MANLFEIKYLFELYPDIDFTEEFVTNQEVTLLMTEYESQATSRKWSHIFDSIHNNRHIQTTVKDKYQVKLVLARNIDINRLNIAYTTLTTTDGDSVVIYDVTVTPDDVQNSQSYVYTIEFYKYSDRIINHLSSDNALSYKSVGNVNELTYTVANPSYVFNNVLVYADEISPGTDQAVFKVPFNDLVDTISIGDKYYVHTNSSDYYEYQDALSLNLNIADCYAKDSDYVYFVCSNDESPSWTNITVNNLILDHEEEYYPYPQTDTIADKEIELTIYTFINPIISNVIAQKEGINSDDGITENQSINSKYNAYLKCWLTTDEMYKAEYLNYALFDEIKLTKSDSTEIVPIQVKDIIVEEEKDALIELHEYNINLKYNNQTVNIFR